MCRPDDVLEKIVRMVVLHKGFGLETPLNHAMGDIEHHIYDSDFGEVEAYIQMHIVRSVSNLLR